MIQLHKLHCHNVLQSEAAEDTKVHGKGTDLFPYYYKVMLGICCKVSHRTAGFRRGPFQEIRGTTMTLYAFSSRIHSIIKLHEGFFPRNQEVYAWTWKSALHARSRFLNKLHPNNVMPNEWVMLYFVIAAWCMYILKIIMSVI